MVEAVAEAFIERYAKPRNRGWAETGRIFKVYVLPKWGSRRSDNLFDDEPYGNMGDEVAPKQLGEED